MSLTFKQKDNEKEQQAEPKHIELYDVTSSVRNVCFVQADGRHVFLNYAYLVSGEYSPDESSITLAFTTHMVLLKGSNLERLFVKFMNHQLKSVAAVDKRYRTIKGEKEITISEIVCK